MRNMPTDKEAIYIMSWICFALGLGPSILSELGISALDAVTALFPGGVGARALSFSAVCVGVLLVLWFSTISIDRPARREPSVRSIAQPSPDNTSSSNCREGTFWGESVLIDDPQVPVSIVDSLHDLVASWQPDIFDEVQSVARSYWKVDCRGDLLYVPEKRRVHWPDSTVIERSERPLPVLSPIDKATGALLYPFLRPGISRLHYMLASTECDDSIKGSCAVHTRRLARVCMSMNMLFLFLF